MTAIIIPFPDEFTRRRIVSARFSSDTLLELGEDEWFEQADHVLDHIEAMLDSGPAHEVLALCEQAVWCLLDAAPEIDDHDAVMTLVTRLGDLHRRAKFASKSRREHA